MTEATRRSLRPLTWTAGPLFLLGFVLAQWVPRPEVHDGMELSAFWARKLSWQGGYDVALAGDSRAYRGLSPDDMARHLPGQRIANFGFPGMGYSPQYLERLAGTLDPDSQNPTVVLCLSANSFRAGAVQRNGFLETLKQHAMPRRIQSGLDRLETLTEPFATEWMLNDWRRAGPPPQTHSRLHPNGWMSTTAQGFTHDAQLAYYKSVLFASDRFSEAAIEAVEAHISKWTRQGIAVFVVRLPIPRTMLALEADFLPVPFTELIMRSERAGATVLSFDMDQYPTYDGSHFVDTVARRFSEDLALAIARHRASREDRTP